MIQFINKSYIEIFYNSSYENYYVSNFVLELSRKVNLFCTLIVFIIGLIGNSLTIYVFSQKRFRINSSNVYLLNLAIIDSFFLIVHIYEDTMRTSKDIYFIGEEIESNLKFDTVNQLIRFVNLTDRFDLSCRLINFLRYVLRFISAYIIVVFTIQRVIIIYSPLKNYFNSKKSAWLQSISIIFISLLVNSWVLFIFNIKKIDNHKICDVKDNWRKEYFLATFIYICLIMFVPIVTIGVSNTMIIYNTVKAKKNRRKMQIMKPRIKNFQADSQATANRFNSKSDSNIKLRPYYYNVEQITKKNINKSDSLKKLKKMLFLISSSYALLNMPYLITWCSFFYNISFSSVEPSAENYLFAAVKMSEIFYLMNYGLKFYLYCAFGTTFRSQLKYSSKNNFIA